MHYDATTLCANIDDIQVKAFLLCVFEMVNTLPLKSQAEYKQKHNLSEEAERFMDYMFKTINKTKE